MLTYIAGIADIAVGILVILLRYSDNVGEFGGQLGVTLFGAANILYGLFAAALASGLYRGRRGARILVTIVMALSLAAAITLAARGTSDVLFAILEIGLPIAIVAALWLHPASRFFAKR